MERRTSVRSAVVWEAVQDVVRDQAAARIVDLGGGTGGFAVRLAQAGHRVTVIDPSPDALAALGRRAHDAEVTIEAQQGDLNDLADLVEAGSCDLVLCHGVLGLLPDPGTAVGTLVAALRPGGVLSLVVNQRHAAVVARAMAGHLAQAKTLLDGADEAGEHRFTADELSALVEPHVSSSQLQGVRVFTDLVPGTLVDLESGASAALLELERAVAKRPEYLSLATRLHLLATR
ncbi:MAG TPA: methyltransferase domain-containing protein [Marmoricola sp.]|nr:methyltransferase domain-containing protein [Marmoricola sp.]